MEQYDQVFFKHSGKAKVSSSSVQKVDFVLCREHRTQRSRGVELGTTEKKIQFIKSSP